MSTETIDPTSTLAPAPVATAEGTDQTPTASAPASDGATDKPDEVWDITAFSTAMHAALATATQTTGEDGSPGVAMDEDAVGAVRDAYSALPSKGKKEARDLMAQARDEGFAALNIVTAKAANDLAEQVPAATRRTRGTATGTRGPASNPTPLHITLMAATATAYFRLNNSTNSRLDAGWQDASQRLMESAVAELSEWEAAPADAKPALGAAASLAQRIEANKATGLERDGSLRQVASKEVMIAHVQQAFGAVNAGTSMKMSELSNAHTAAAPEGISSPSSLSNLFFAGKSPKASPVSGVTAGFDTDGKKVLTKN